MKKSTSSVNYKTSDFDIFGQGFEPSAIYKDKVGEIVLRYAAAQEIPAMA